MTFMFPGSKRFCVTVLQLRTKQSVIKMKLQMLKGKVEAIYSSVRHVDNDNIDKFTSVTDKELEAHCMSSKRQSYHWIHPNPTSCLPCTPK